MSILKNSFGVSIAFTPRISPINFVNKLAGSSLERKPKSELAQLIEKTPVEAVLSKPLKLDASDESNYKFRGLSARSKSKIRRKVIAFSRVCKKLTFVTLTFLNKVTDRQALKALGAFLDNVSKRCNDFQYLWVAEKQSKNEVFTDNIHFHLITNKFWELNRWWSYWIEVQKKQGIVPRNENFKPSSAFDVKVITSNNKKGVGSYITKYVTKNSSQFQCMVWNCSRKISRLYTTFYSDMNFLGELERLEASGQLGGKIITHNQENCSVHLIPLNNITSKLYARIDQKNRIVWNDQQTEKRA